MRFPSHAGRTAAYRCLEPRNLGHPWWIDTHASGQRIKLHAQETHSLSGGFLHGPKPFPAASQGCASHPRRQFLTGRLGTFITDSPQTAATTTPEHKLAPIRPRLFSSDPTVAGFRMPTLPTSAPGGSKLRNLHLHAAR